MEKEKFQIRLIDYLSGLMNDVQRKDFELLLKQDKNAYREFKELEETWKGLRHMEIPEPSAEMDAVFYEMLHEKMAKAEKGPTKNILANFLEYLWKPQLAYGLLLLAIGLGMGYYLSTNTNPVPEQTVVDTNSETEEIREQLVLTLIEQPSANKRLQGVSEATKMSAATESVIKALFATLDNDANINVRLAALESLSKYAENPVVRLGLIQSISKQESPLVQIALADLMVALQEKKSVESIKKLLEQPDLDTTLKQKLEESINHII